MLITFARFLESPAEWKETVKEGMDKALFAMGNKGEIEHNEGVKLKKVLCLCAVQSWKKKKREKNLCSLGRGACFNAPRFKQTEERERNSADKQIFKTIPLRIAYEGQTFAKHLTT